MLDEKKVLQEVVGVVDERGLLNLWPCSQVCIGCQHGELALDVDESSAYYCSLGIRPDDSGECA